MTLTVNSITFDATSPDRLATFWAAVFELEPPEPINPYVSILRPEHGPQLMFIAVPEAKVAKNRCHLDLHAADAAEVDSQVARLLEMGATLVGGHEEYGVYWSTIQDPEGNELCIGTPVSP